MFSNVIVAVDDQESGEVAMRVAQTVAQCLDVPVDLIAVALVDDPEDHRNHERALAALGNDDAARIRRNLLTGGRVDGRLANFGRAFDAPLYVLVTRAGGGLLTALRGSTAEHLMQRVSDPVVMIGARAEVGPTYEPGPVIATTDGSDHAATMLALAAWWAREVARSELLVVTVDHEERRIMNMHPDDLGALADEHGATPVVLNGRDPAAAVVDLASQRRASLVAMSTHGRDGVARTLLGSVTLRVVHDSPCPVLVRRPEAMELESVGADPGDADG